MFGADGQRLRQLRRDMQIVSQDPYAAWNPRKTVRSILTEPVACHFPEAVPSLIDDPALST